LRKRKKIWFENSLLDRTRLSGFLLLSLGLHITFVIAHTLLPKQEKVISGPPPIQVKYIESNKEQNLKYRKIVDAPKPPLRKEKPNREELLAKFDNRSHSNQKSRLKKIYKRKKTIVPKSRSIIGSNGARKSKTKKVVRKKKFRTKPFQKNRKKPFPKSDAGNFEPTPQTIMDKPKLLSKKRFGKGSALALLDGFNAEQFASLDTDSFEDSDDDEPVSLDTKEEKYASYFARIKHQIERVWVYPSDAAQRGIVGDLSLTFRISKDGNLMGVRLVDQSGYEILDLAALKAVKEAAPFYPFPTNIRRDKITILANFVYSPPSEYVPR
jgi:protein TonB